MGYVKAAFSGIIAAAIAITAADMLGDKLPPSLAVGGKDLRPYIAGGLTLAVAGAVLHAVTKS